jgi:hypothetical protein
LQEAFSFSSSAHLLSSPVKLNPQWNGAQTGSKSTRTRGFNMIHEDHDEDVKQEAWEERQRWLEK